MPASDERVVVVTGAARGQGLALTRMLRDAGMGVAAVDLPGTAPEVTASGAEYRAMDVSDEDAWISLAADLAARHAAPLHGLVNNAGITHRARVGDVARADWDRVLAVNLTGALLGIQALAPLMAAGSSIVNVGSVAGLTGHYPVAYTASKWALRGLTHAAAGELGPRGIRVNIVHPGFIDTDMTASAPDGMRKAQRALTPLQRTGAADEVAAVVAFLLSDAAAYVTGAELPVDGGQSSSAGTKVISDRLSSI